MKKCAERTSQASLFACAYLVSLLAASSGCEGSEEPIPQEQSWIDLDQDPDNRGSGIEPRAETEDPNPGSALKQPGEPAAPQAQSGRGYDRAKALDYVRRYAKSPNREVAYCAGWGLSSGRPVKIPADCTNFASQVLWYGGLPMNPAHDDTGWWYTDSCEWWGSSVSWRTVNGLAIYLTTISGRAVFARRARDLKIGDLIFYRLRRPETGYRCDIGSLFNHTTIVSGFDERGEPLVSYHSNEAEDVPWNAKSGSLKALGEACATGFVHLLD